MGDGVIWDHEEVRVLPLRPFINTKNRKDFLLLYINLTQKLEANLSCPYIKIYLLCQIITTERRNLKLICYQCCSLKELEANPLPTSSSHCSWFSRGDLKVSKNWIQIRMFIFKNFIIGTFDCSAYLKAIDWQILY